MTRQFWSERLPIAGIHAGQSLSVLLPAPAIVHWGVDQWGTITDTPTRDTGIGVHVADLPVATLRAGQCMDFTWRLTDPDRWAGKDFHVDVR